MSAGIYDELALKDDGPFVVVSVEGIDGVSCGVSKNPSDVFPPILFREVRNAHQKMLELNAELREEE